MSKAGKIRWHRNQARKQRRAESRAMNAAMLNPATGMGCDQDRSNINTVPAPFSRFNPFKDGIGQIFAAKLAYDLYATDWMAQKLVDLPVFDTFRDGWNWTYKGNDTKVDEALQEEADRLDVLDVFQKTNRLERLLGGAVIIIGVNEKEGVTEAQPLDMRSIGKGDLLFLNSVGRNYITKCEWDWSPTSPDYGRPSHYWIDGKQFHRSRLIIFDGNPVSPNPSRDFSTDRASWDGFGLSVYSAMYDSLVRALETQQGASHLVNTSSIWAVIVKNLRDIQLSKCGGKQLSELERIVHEMSNFRGIMLNGVDTDIKQLSANFGSVPELTMTFLQIVCAGADIPAARFLGTTPSGLNTDGESWQESYYTSIEVKRKLRIERHFKNRLLPLLCSSVFGPGVVDHRLIKTEWPELRSMSEVEKAQIRTLDTNNIVNLASTLGFPDEWAVDELVKRGVITGKPDLEAMEREQMRQEAQMFGDGQANGETATDDVRIPGGTGKPQLPRMPAMGLGTGGGLPRMPAMNAGKWDETNP